MRNKGYVILLCTRGLVIYFLQKEKEVKRQRKLLEQQMENEGSTGSSRALVALETGKCLASSCDSLGQTRYLLRILNILCCTCR